MMISQPQEKNDRLTISLAPGQRDDLERIADHNHTSLAFVVRYALTRLTQQYGDRQLPLDFPELH